MLATRGKQTNIMLQLDGLSLRIAEKRNQGAVEVAGSNGKSRAGSAAVPDIVTGGKRLGATWLRAFASSRAMEKGRYGGLEASPAEGETWVESGTSLWRRASSNSSSTPSRGLCCFGMGGLDESGESGTI